MALAGVAFVGYGVVFLVLNFVGSGFELGVSTLDGMTPADLNPTVAYYISHLHVATAAFIISTGIAVAGLSWYGIRQRLRWAWATAVVAAVVGLALALPMHWTGDAFAHDWITHLGPIYLATIVFVVGAVLSYQGMRRA
jgi:cytochrome bd-type quinol oxidase subunit 1